MRRRRDQDLAAEMAALLFRCQLVFIVNTRRTRLDEGLHDFESVERPAETGLRIGNDRREPGIDRKALALRRLDLVGALQGAVDALCKLRRRIGGIKRLVRIHGRRRIGIRRNLPAREIDRLQPGANHLHGLVAGKRAERIDEIFLVDQLPQPVRAHFGQRMADFDGAAQPLHIRGGVSALDAVEASLRCTRNKFVKIRHTSLSLDKCRFGNALPSTL
ncbi:hypothetical protein D3C86_1135490 [compost metagenome]